MCVLNKRGVHTYIYTDRYTYDIHIYHVHICIHIIYIYLYDHSSSDKEIAGRGPGRGEKANEEAFEDDGSMPRRAILFHHQLVVVVCST